MSCHNTDLETLSQFVDGAVSPAEELELRRHLDTCAVCRARVDALIRLKQAVASGATIHPVPHGLRERVNQMGEASRGPKHRAAWLAGAAAIAAGLLIVVLFSTWSTRRYEPEVDQLREAMIADHIHYLGVPEPAAIVSGDPRKLSAALAPELGFGFQLPALRNTKLLGGRLCRLRGQRAALTIYEHGDRRVSLFLLDSSTVRASVPRESGCSALGRYEVCLVEANQIWYALVAERYLASELAPDLRAQLGEPR
jgi:anti-sigma factor RsiW